MAPARFTLLISLATASSRNRTAWQASHVDSTAHSNPARAPRRVKARAGEKCIICRSALALGCSSLRDLIQSFARWGGAAGCARTHPHRRGSLQKRVSEERNTTRLAIPDRSRLHGVESAARSAAAAERGNMTTTFDGEESTLRKAKRQAAPVRNIATDYLDAGPFARAGIRPDDRFESTGRDRE